VFRTLTVVAACFALAACAAAQHSEPRTATVPIEGASRIEIRAGAGYLRVDGQPNVASVTINGTARAPRASELRRIQLVAERRGEVVIIQAVLPEARRQFVTFGTSSATLDLDIVVPAGIPVYAHDGSGEAHFRGTGPLRVVDGSGALVIEDVMGEVDVSDGSGAITVRNVTGPLRVRDGSGAIRIEDVGHDITIHDGSGAIVVRRVGNLHIASSGSGGITVAEATGTVRITDPGSGRVSVRDVGGDLIVERGRSSRITHANVRGRVVLPSR
jgi:hypothetical protein